MNAHSPIRAHSFDHQIKFPSIVPIFRLLYFVSKFHLLILDNSFITRYNLFNSFNCIKSVFASFKSVKRLFHLLTESVT